MKVTTSMIEAQRDEAQRARRARLFAPITIRIVGSTAVGAGGRVYEEVGNRWFANHWSKPLPSGYLMKPLPRGE